MYPILQPYQNQLQNLQNQMLTPTPASITAPTIQYVNGRQSVDNYAMQPNTSVILMDSTKDTFYIKKADASGSCTVESYDFRKSKEDTRTEYVTRAEFDELKQMIKEGKHEQLNERKRNDAGSRSNDARGKSADVPSEHSEE